MVVFMQSDHCAQTLMVINNNNPRPLFLADSAKFYHRKIEGKGIDGIEVKFVPLSFGRRMIPTLKHVAREGIR